MIMLDSILFYLHANYPVLMLAVAGYALFREVGAVAAGAFGQYFVSVGSISSGYELGDRNGICTAMSYLCALVPLTLFACVPGAHHEVSRAQGTLNRLSNPVGFWAILFAAISVNHWILDVVIAPPTGGAAWGASIIAVMLGCAAAILGKSKEHESGLARPAPLPSSQAFSQDPCGSFATEPTGVSRLDQAPLGPVVGDEDTGSQVTSMVGQVSTYDRPSPMLSTAYLFNRNEFFIYRHDHLQDLEALIRREPPGVLAGLHTAICRRLGRTQVAGDERAFTRAYVAQFRKRIASSYPEFLVPERLDRRAA